MKIALISPNTQHLEQLTHMLRDAGHQATPFEGGKSRVREVAEQERPEIMLVDGICRDLGELGQVEQLTALDPRLDIVLMCSDHTPEFLLQAMRAGVREVLPSPPTSETLLASVERLASKRQREKTLATGRLLAFLACKGGSGATFLATNLGWELSERHKVLLLDLNMQFGDALAYVHDGKATRSIADLARDIRRLDVDLLAASTVKLSAGYSLLPAPENLSDAADIRPDVVGPLLDVACANYDFVIVDLPRNLDAAGIATLDRAWRVYPVLQASLPDLRHAARLLAAFGTLGYSGEKVEFILNRFQKNQDIGLADIRRTLGEARIQTVPNEWADVHASIATGSPVRRMAGGSAVAHQLHEMAKALTPAPPQAAPDQRSLFNKLFRRA